MPDRRVGQVGRLGLLVRLLSVRRALLLNYPELGPFGIGGSNEYRHFCQQPGCTANTFSWPSKDPDYCSAGHQTLVAVVVGGAVPAPTRSAGQYIYACLLCKRPPERLDSLGNPKCRRHGAMTLLACP